MEAPSRDALMRALAPSHVFQPATLLWRVFEIEAILRHARLRGQGVDVGCGDGELARVVFDAMATRPVAIGVDPDASDHALAERSATYVRVHRTTGDAIPEPSASMDFVFSNSTLEHIPDVDAVLVEAARLLKPGGQFLFTVPSEEFHACLRGSLLLGAIARARGRTYRERIDERVAHLTYRSPGAWAAALGPLGLEVTSSVRYFPRVAVRAWERISNATSGLLYEAFDGRRSTRTIQSGLGLSRRRDGPAAALVLRLLRLLARDALRAEVRGGEPSGGLLVLARRAPA
ncbi:MAG TPA: class I SAM-dependent methyltransferase [Candidatus Limnocylindria bacterium]|nr:class I SAM-dependent methyltransferase [Candidatus Limnocylindria bacterium]